MIKWNSENDTKLQSLKCLPCMTPLETSETFCAFDKHKMTLKISKTLLASLLVKKRFVTWFLAAKQSNIALDQQFLIVKHLKFNYQTKCFIPFDHTAKHCSLNSVWSKHNLNKAGKQALFVEQCFVTWSNIAWRENLKLLANNVWSPTIATMLVEQLCFWQAECVFKVFKNIT